MPFAQSPPSSETISPHWSTLTTTSTAPPGQVDCEAIASVVFPGEVGVVSVAVLVAELQPGRAIVRGVAAGGEAGWGVGRAGGGGGVFRSRPTGRRFESCAAMGREDSFRNDNHFH